MKSDVRTPPPDVGIETALAFHVVGIAGFVRRHVLSLVITLVLAAIAGVGYALHLTPRYTARASVLFHVPPPEVAKLGGILEDTCNSDSPNALPVLSAQLARGYDILGRVLEAPYAGRTMRAALAAGRPVTDRELIAEVQGLVSTEASRSRSMVAFTATHTDADLAAALLDQVLAQLTDYLDEALRTALAFQRQVAAVDYDHAAAALRQAEHQLVAFDRLYAGQELSATDTAYRLALTSELAIAATEQQDLRLEYELARLGEQYLQLLVEVLEPPFVSAESAGPARGKVAAIIILVAFALAVGGLALRDVLCQYQDAALAG